jgi:RHS repeat-associated protein
MAGYQTGGNNRLTNDGVYTYSFDNAGNVIQKSKGSGQETWYYGYDNLNHMTSARKTSDGTTNVAWSTFTYDVEGHLVSEQDWTSGGSATTTRFAWDGDNLWAELDTNNNPLVRYVSGDAVNQILTRTVASGGTAGVWAYFTDAQGSVRDLVNWSGQVQDHLDYSGYGVATESNPGVGDQFKYDGYIYLGLAGLYQVGARIYNPTTGNWTSQDPLGFEAGDSNLYRYVPNLPVAITHPAETATRSGRAARMRASSVRATTRSGV